MNKIKPIFEETGGIRIGISYWFASNWTWPLVKMLVFKNKLILSYGSTKIELRKSEIIYIKKYEGWFSEGIRICHKKVKTVYEETYIWSLDFGFRNRYNQVKTPPFILFWTFNANEIIHKMKKLGYKVK